MVLLLLVTALVVPVTWPLRARTVCTTDIVQARAVAGLANFSSWLRRNDATGFIGEIGWPADRDAQQWTGVAEAWYDAADVIGLPVTAWAAGTWPANYPMAVYRPVAHGMDVDVAGPQAKVVERHGSAAGYLRGVNLAAGSFATSEVNGGFGSANPGRYGHDYTYETPQSYEFLAGRGVRLVRLAVNWERLQPVPFAPSPPTRWPASAPPSTTPAPPTCSSCWTCTAMATSPSAAACTDRPCCASAAPAYRRPPSPTSGAAWPLLLTTPPSSAWACSTNRPASPPTAEPAPCSGNAPPSSPSTRSAPPATAAPSSSAATSRWAPVLGPHAPRAWIRDPLQRVAYESHAYFDHDGSGHYWQSYDDELRNVTWPHPTLCQHLTPLTRQVLQW